MPRNSVATRYVRVFFFRGCYITIYKMDVVLGSSVIVFYHFFLPRTFFKIVLKQVAVTFFFDALVQVSLDVVIARGSSWK